MGYRNFCSKPSVQKFLCPIVQKKFCEKYMKQAKNKFQKTETRNLEILLMRHHCNLCLLNDFRIGQYICLNRGRLFNSIGNSSVIFSRNNTIKQSQSPSTRRNLNRLLWPMIINKEIQCRENSYKLSDLCHHDCTSSCEKLVNEPKPCYIEEIATSIDL